jgi:protein-S-isoprenylcysteine O-methyltransferase Ste14
MIKFIPISFLILSIFLTYIGRKFLIIEVSSFLGILIITFALTIIFLGLSTLILNRTTIIPGDKPKKLVKEGIFRFIRNPIYFGDLLLVIGFSLLFKTLIGFFISIFFFFIFDRIVIPIEEKILEETFKEEYINYKKNVKRWGIF